MIIIYKKWWKHSKFVNMENFKKFRIIDAVFVVGSILTFIADQATGLLKLFSQFLIVTFNGFFVTKSSGFLLFYKLKQFYGV